MTPKSGLGNRHWPDSWCPHIVLFVNSNLDRSGANVHWPTASLNSSATEDISSSLRKLIHDAREDLWQRRRGQHDP